MDSTDRAGLPDAPDTTGERGIRVLVVDDHDVLADSLGHVIDAEPDLETVGVAETLEAARALLTATEVDVILLDHSLPDGDGVSAMPALQTIRPGVRIVVLTADSSDEVLLTALEHGAAGFLPKSRSLGEVTSAVRAAAAGESVISPELLMRLLPQLDRATPSGRAELTAREREVLGLLAEGLTNTAIANRLALSVHTVRNHIANLCAKLGAHSKLEALSIAVRQGILPRS